MMRKRKLTNRVSEVAVQSFYILVKLVRGLCTGPCQTVLALVVG